MSHERLLDRFLRYVAIDTTAIEGADGYPSSHGQFQLGAMLVKELTGLGITDVRQNEHGLVLATLPANKPDIATVVLNAHLDTSPETTGKGVKPQLIRKYSGGDLQLVGDPLKVIRVAENPELCDLRGCTLVTTDGTTLLGGDDKAGIAVIMEATTRLVEDSDIDHGPVRILFTCDEEIGRGVEFVDIGLLDAAAAYTLDGPGVDQVDVETFSADLATVTVHGVNIHPSIAKDRMVNAVKAAADFVGRLPSGDLSPETTAGRDGFIHPYQMQGGVAEVTLKVLLRDFETSGLEAQAALLRSAASDAESAFPGTSIAVDVRPQYRNMREGLDKEPRAVKYAMLAHERLGREARCTVIRGGTDGSQFTERGLAAPNLSTGQHNPHSPLEWVCLDEMARASELLVELLRVWGEDPGVNLVERRCSLIESTAFEKQSWLGNLHKRQRCASENFGEAPRDLP